MFLAAASNASAKTLYLNTGGTSLWEKDGARFAVYAFGSSTQWYDMSAVSGESGVYQASVGDQYPNVIFCRMNGSTTENIWGNMWNQTEDLTVPADKDLYTITGWNQEDGEWSKHGETPGGGDPITPTDYDKAVPAQCADVMLQGFYWESNVNNGYGDTKWATLNNQAAEIGTYFDLIWLPPSAQASGISLGGLGYIPLVYSSQTCQMGKRANLDQLINSLHENGVRVIADIVINHIGNGQNLCDDLKTHNFGSFGSFSPTKDWLTSDDEGNCGSNGHPDDGQNTPWQNFESARDWDHRNTNVQNMCKAYLQWMRAVMQYDGWRYDMVGGYNVSHVNDYNVASRPYFSVIEYWDDGSASTIKTRISQADHNTLAFDFPGRMMAFKNGIAKGSYANCKNAGLRGQGYSKYAVTFVDNHDTFNRAANNVTDVCDKGDGSSINNQSVMLQCNAYLLSMPGVPCVFWPHWVKYKSEIKAMINARRMAGVHSESSVQEESGNGYYRATVQGKYGSVKLMLGTAANDAAPAGYTQAVKGTDYAMYYTGTGPQGVENVQSEQKGEKFIENGQLYIRCGEHVFDAQGRRMY